MIYSVFWDLQKVAWLIFLCTHIYGVVGLDVSGCDVQCGTEPAYKYADNEQLPVAKIVNGNVARDGTSPWMAAVLWKNTKNLSCGATILTNYWLLTSGTCTRYMDSKFVQVGFHDFENPGQYVQQIEIANSYRHQKFQSKKLWNDIALIQLKKPIMFSDYVQPICLPTRKLVDGDELRVAGWGLLAFRGELPTKLMDTNVPFIPMDKCKKLLGAEVVREKHNICLGRGDTGPCHGDTGGSAVRWNDQTNSFEQAGIISWVYGCPTLCEPGIYTNVYSYVDWIKDTMAAHSQPGDFGCY